MQVRPSLREKGVRKGRSKRDSDLGKSPLLLSHFTVSLLTSSYSNEFFTTLFGPTLLSKILYSPVTFTLLWHRYCDVYLSLSHTHTHTHTHTHIHNLSHALTPTHNLSNTTPHHIDIQQRNGGQRMLKQCAHEEEYREPLGTFLIL